MMPDNKCERCGAPLPTHALKGRCPRCLLLEGLDSDASGTGQRRNGGPPGLALEAGSVLETIAQSIGRVPRVLLRDTSPGEEPGPIVRPPGALADDRSTRYRIDGEIARGGMGAVLKGRDPDLGRDVAIKVLREDLRDNGDLISRFVEEAQIGGQLQHPGVVPIYELGTFADQRPYFSMKLVKGQTLADLLSERGRVSAPSPPGADATGLATDLPRFLSIFAAVAQTMAYSHTRGVIHRDLKPSNVMVGSFGEVQVMDWGLAKVLPRGGIADDAKAGKEPQETVIATGRSGQDAPGLSHPGSAMGTPSYMAPEQARGETDLINERADVFALGSILCEILTGSPAFTGRGSGEILRKAGRGDTVDALARLDGCGVEAELIAIAKDCLAVEPEDRPRDAKVVSDRVTAYLSGVQERVHAAERERAVAVARAIEERRRRKLQLALAASVLALTTLGGLSSTYYLQQRAERARQETEQAAAVDRVVGQAETLRQQASAHPEDVSRWEVAMAAVRQAEAAQDEAARPRLLALRAQVKAGLDAAARDKTLLDRLVDIRSAEADDSHGSISDHDYAQAFREAGIEFVGQAPAEAGAKIKARPASVSLSLAAALDDWAATRRQNRRDSAGATQLSEAARVADPDPWRNELRKALDQSDKAARLTGLRALARTAKFDELGAISVQLLGNGLSDAGDGALAESVLRTGLERHPGDVWVNHSLAKVLENQSRRDEAIRFYTAARSIRPETAHELAHALEKRGDSDEAIAVFRDLRRLRPGNSRHLGCLGKALSQKGLSREADEILEAAVAAWRSAVRLKPDCAEAHQGLGAVLCDGKHDYEGAEAEFREVIRLNPDYAGAHCDLGNALKAQGNLQEAIAEYRAATRLEPDFAVAHANLGVALDLQGKVSDAVAAYREAIRLKPDLAEAHNSLGAALSHQGKQKEAVAAYREEIRLKPDYAEAHCNLGLVLRSWGEYAAALDALHTGHALGSKRPGWPNPSAEWVRQAERLAALADRLPAILRGDDRPADNAERLALAEMCYDTKRFGAAARLWAEALAADPKLGDDRRAGYYDAACAAALAGSGQGKDHPPLDDAAKATLRGQARDWLKAELATWMKLFETGPATTHQVIAKDLNHWKEDADLAGIREAGALAKLPEAERKAWQALWADVASLQSRAATPTAAEAKSSGTTPARPDAPSAESRPFAPPRQSLAPRDPQARRCRGARPLSQTGPRTGTFQACRSRAAVPQGARRLPQDPGTGRGFDPRPDGRPGQPPVPVRPRCGR
jgi:serine/threonine-protein kinase